MVRIAQIRQDQYPATDETQCIKVYLPVGDEFKQLLAGLISVPCRIENYEDPESAQSDGLMSVWQDAYLQTDWNGCGTAPECQNMNSEITLSPLNMLIGAGNALTRVANSTQLDSVYYHQSPAVNNQLLAANRFMAKGDWSYRLVGWKAADSGILELTIFEGGVYNALTVTSDFYNATNSANHYVAGDFQIDHDGLHSIQFKTTGKNASSSAYLQRITTFEAWRWGDI